MNKVYYNYLGGSFKGVYVKAPRNTANRINETVELQCQVNKTSTYNYVYYITFSL